MQYFNFTFMSFVQIVFIICDAYCQDTSGIFWSFSKPSFETKSILPVFDLPDCFIGSVIDL